MLAMASAYSAIRRHSRDKMVRLVIGTASTNDTATMALGTAYAGFNAEVITGVESDGVTKTDNPTATVDSSGNLILTESSDGFEDGDVFLVAVAEHPFEALSPTMSTA